MYVCYCAGITDHEVHAAIDTGADCLEAIGERTGAGTGCGGCQPSIEAIVAQRCGECPRRSLAVA